MLNICNRSWTNTLKSSSRFQSNFASRSLRILWVQNRRCTQSHLWLPSCPTSASACFKGWWFTCQWVKESYESYTAKLWRPSRPYFYLSLLSYIIDLSWWSKGWREGRRIWSGSSRLSCFRLQLPCAILCDTVPSRSWPIDAALNRIKAVQESIQRLGMFEHGKTLETFGSTHLWWWITNIGGRTSVCCPFKF